MSKILCAAKWLCAILLATVLSYTGWKAYQEHHAASVMQELHNEIAAQQVQSAQPSGNSTPTEQQQDAQAAQDTQITAFPAFLQQENADLAAWLTVPGTEVDYPVMLTPDDMEYYLHRDFYKKHSACGTPFFDTRCAPVAEADSLIVHGHNMRDGTMFTSLNRYVEPAFGAEHPNLRLLLPGETRTYQLLAVVKINKDTDADLYNCVGKLSQEQFDRFVQTFRARAVYDTGVQPQYGDKLLVLSTCFYEGDSNRLLVIGCEKNA